VVGELCEAGSGSVGFCGCGVDLLGLCRGVVLEGVGG
jgi:hypothetical protein